MSEKKFTYSVNVYQPRVFFDEHGPFDYPTAIECYRHYTKKHKEDKEITVDLIDNTTGEVIETSDWEE